MSASTRSEEIVTRLREQLPDRLITPSHPDYESARGGFYAGVDRRPAAIVRAIDDTDVIRTVTLVRDSGIPLAVRSGGHSMAHHSQSDGGIVLDLSAMKALRIDADRHTAWAEAGLTAGELMAAAGDHGMVVGFGDSASVGIGGITLGGGVGYLSRLHGLTIDNVLAADVVTADGELLRADADTNPDLFWAIRGGGGNFGVVLRFQYRLHDLAEVVGGMLILPATAPVIAAIMAELAAAGDELSMIVNVMVAPPMPFLPDEVHGRLVVMALTCYAGPADAGQRALAPFRALGTPLVDTIRPMGYPELYPPEPEFHPNVASRNLFLEAVDETVGEVMLDRLRQSSAAMSVVNLRTLGGAVGRVPAEATAFAHRDRRIMANVAALYLDPEAAAEHEAWASGLAAALQDGDAAAYVNFVGDEGPDRVRDIYPPATWARLSALKRRYDPTNLFRANHNIPPAG